MSVFRGTQQEQNARAEKARQQEAEEFRQSQSQRHQQNTNKYRQYEQANWKSFFDGDWSDTDDYQEDASRYERLFRPKENNGFTTGMGAKVKVVFRALAKKWHPDKGGTKEAMQALNDAQAEIEKIL